MGEYDFTDNLVALTTFCNPSEASRASARLERVGIDACLGDDEPVELLVRQGDLRQARKILADLLRQPESQVDEDDGYEDDYDADDWSGEDWADDDEDDYEPYSEEPAETPPLTRAWRAALIGGLLLPCLLINIYSVWLIVQHQLWRPQPGETSVNWRFPAALFFNLVGVVFFWLIIRW